MIILEKTMPQNSVFTRQENILQLLCPTVSQMLDCVDIPEMLAQVNG